MTTVAMDKSLPGDNSYPFDSTVLIGNIIIQSFYLY